MRVGRRSDDRHLARRTTRKKEKKGATCGHARVRGAYAQADADHGQRAMINATRYGVEGVYDDHDFGENDGEQFFNVSTILDRSSLPAWPMICLLGHYCDGTGEPVPCPAGKLGNATGLATAACAGECPAIFYCTEGSVAALP